MKGYSASHILRTCIMFFTDFVVRGPCVVPFQTPTFHTYQVETYQWHTCNKVNNVSPCHIVVTSRLVRFLSTSHHWCPRQHLNEHVACLAHLHTQSAIDSPNSYLKKSVIWNGCCQIPACSWLYFKNLFAMVYWSVRDFFKLFILIVIKWDKPFVGAISVQI